MALEIKFQDSIPPISQEERDLLEESLYSDGCREPLVTWINPEDSKEYILDGHNRYEICERLGIPYEYRVIDLPEGMTPEEWIFRNQLGRRNLSDPDRIKIALELESIFAKQAKANQRQGGNSSKVGRQNSAEPLETREMVAKAAGVSRDTIAKAKAILGSGQKEIISEWEGKELSTHAAFLKVKEAKHPIPQYTGNIEFDPREHRSEIKKAEDKVFGRTKPEKKPPNTEEVISHIIEWIDWKIKLCKDKISQPAAPVAELLVEIRTLQMVKGRILKVQKDKGRNVANLAF